MATRRFRVLPGGPDLARSPSLSLGVVVLIVVMLFLFAFIVFPSIGGRAVSGTRTFVTSVKQEIQQFFITNTTHATSNLTGNFTHMIDAGPGSNWNCLSGTSFVNFTVNGAFVSKTLADGAGSGSIRTFNDTSWSFPVGTTVVSDFVVDEVGVEDAGSIRISNTDKNELVTVTTPIC